jgi:hypothetical protein
MRRMGIRFGYGLTLSAAALLGLVACGDSGSKDTTVVGGDAGPTGGTGGAGGDVGGNAGGTGGGPGADMGTGGLTPDALVADSGTPVEECPAMTGYGYIAAPIALTSAPKGAHSPRAVWTGTEWGVTWFAPSETEADLGNIKFQRFNTMGQPVGDEHDLGLARQTRYDLVWNGGGYLIVWLGARDRAGQGFEGIRVQALAADGSPVDVATDVQNTFEAERVAFGFAPLTGGLIVYTKGRNGIDGVFAQILGEGGEVSGQPVRLTGDGAAGNYPAVAFGDGTWGVAWADPSAATPSAVVFKLLNERAQVVREGNLPNAIGAKGNIFLTYGGSDTFGLAWNQESETGNLEPKLTLISASDASVQVSPDVTGPTGFGTVTDLAWHDPNFFGVAWQDVTGGVQSAGITRIDPLGVSQPPFALTPPAGANIGGLSAGGTVSNLGAFYTLDTDPTPTGFSESAQIYLARLGACR